MIVGQNPGFNEARLGRPFIGRSGQLLDRILDAAGLSRKEIYITNTVKHKTPENRAPFPEEVSICGAFLSEEYERVKPKVVILMGAVAQQEVFHTTPSKANGVWRYKDDHVVVGCFHPAYLLRTPHEVANVIEIFKKVKEYANV